MKIAYKEAEETQYWLCLSKDAASYPDPPEELFIQLQSILKIVGKILITASKQ